MGRKATIGQWYLSQETDELFEVVALDEDTGSIDVQYFDGSIGEYDLETWKDLRVATCAAPEDASGIYEMEYGEIDDTDESAEDFSDEYALDDLHIFSTSGSEDRHFY